MSIRRFSPRATLLLLLANLLLADGATAQDANANAQKNALAKAQFMLRQATGEKAELQQQADALKQQVETLSKELAVVKAASSDNKQKMEEKFSGTIQQWQQHDAKSNEQLAALRAQLKEQSEQRAQLEGRLKIQSDNFAQCYANNKQLFDLNRELLAHYQKKGVLDAVRQKEPFTGLKEVEIENLVQDYRYRNDDLQVSAPAGELVAPTANTEPAANTAPAAKTE
jgi:predicted  nucleic acid-binding Zn-ribbon protein